jgi:AcrR family transcriptional regulator
MPPVPAREPARIRRPPERARQEILDAAERHLVTGGPDAVRVQVVAREIGISDAAVHYHFGSREGLLEALLRRAGRGLREQITDALESQPLDVGVLAEHLRNTYSALGYARLTAWLLLAGWRPSGRGMLRAQAEAMHLRRAGVASADRGGSPGLEDTLFSLVLLNLFFWAEPLVGPAALEMVGLPGDEPTAGRLRGWLVQLVEDHLTQQDHPRQ